MQFRALGPVEVLGEDGPIRLGRGKRRALLVLLLVHANEVVSSDRLIDALWGGRPLVRRGEARYFLIGGAFGLSRYGNTGASTVQSICTQVSGFSGGSLYDCAGKATAIAAAG